MKYNYLTTDQWEKLYTEMISCKNDDNSISETTKKWTELFDQQENMAKQCETSDCVAYHLLLLKDAFDRINKDKNLRDHVLAVSDLQEDIDECEKYQLGLVFSTSPQMHILYNKYAALKAREDCPNCVDLPSLTGTEISNTGGKIVANKGLGQILDGISNLFKGKGQTGNTLEQAAARYQQNEEKREFNEILKNNLTDSTENIAKVSGQLVDATKGKGNFGIGTATAAEAETMGKAWVGNGYKVASDGKTLISADGLRQFRPPSFKPRLNKIQANFERRFPGQATKRWQANAHLDIE